jgi:endonuclease YncB( thermonuclease family)
MKRFLWGAFAFLALGIATSHAAQPFGNESKQFLTGMVDKQQVQVVSGNFTFPAYVLYVTDGDTVAVLNGGKKTKIRFFSIDAPEVDHKLSLGEEGPVTDKYGRTVGTLFLRDGTNVNAEMIRNGMAWWYAKYAPEEVVLARYEAEARHAGIGIWTENDPLPPWIFRHPEQRAEWDRTKCALTSRDCPAGGEAVACSYTAGDRRTFEEYAENECVTMRLLEYQLCRAGLPFDPPKADCRTP